MLTVSFEHSKWRHSPPKKRGVKSVNSKKEGASSEKQVKLTSSKDRTNKNKRKNFETLATLKQPSLIYDIVSRGQFVGTENDCCANKLV